MASNPLITFKAGRCEKFGKTVTPIPGPGYLYLYSEDDLFHLCWRPRSAPATSPEIDLITIPGDASFTPLVRESSADDVRSPTNGRIFVLQFSSSGDKQFFWMQSRAQHGEGDANWFSQRDQRLGQIVDACLSGEDIDMGQEMEDIQPSGSGDGDGDGEGHSGDHGEAMDLDRPENHTGGAGQDATGGDPREEGEASREGGADGGRAPHPSQSQDTSAIVRNFLDSLGTTNRQQQGGNKPYTTLPDLLSSNTTVPHVTSLSESAINDLCAYLPHDLFLSQSSPDFSTTIAAMDLEQKRDILRRVLRSPQLHQSLGSLTIAIRDGGLSIVGEALGLKCRHVPQGGGEAVESFVEGAKRKVEEDEAKGDGK